MILLIAVSLSMDAFSLALIYGTLNLKSKEMLILSTIVGLYHFFMPNIGSFIGNTLLNIFPLKPNIIIFIVLTLIGIEMIIETFKKNEKLQKMNLIEMFAFGFAVSLDSFSLGIGLKAITNNVIISSIVFSVFSFLFTMMGLFLGKKTSLLLGKTSTLLGGIILIIIAFSYIS